EAGNARLDAQAAAVAGRQPRVPGHVLPGVVGVELDLDPMPLEGRKVGVRVVDLEAEEVGVEGNAPGDVADDQVQRGAAQGGAVLGRAEPGIAGPALGHQLCLILEVYRVQELFARAGDLLPRPHYLDQLLASLGWADHDRADQPVVEEEE